MSKEKTIHYEPHPVSPDRKAELIAKGVRIVDAALAPVSESGAPPESVERRLLLDELVNLSLERMGDVPIDELRSMVAGAKAAKQDWQEAGRQQADHVEPPPSASAQEAVSDVAEAATEEPQEAKRGRKAKPEGDAPKE